VSASFSGSLIRRTGYLKIITLDFCHPFCRRSYGSIIENLLVLAVGFRCRFAAECLSDFAGAIARFVFQVAFLDQ